MGEHLQPDGTGLPLRSLAQAGTISVAWDPVPGATGYLDTDYAAKGAAAVEALDRYDLVIVHVEAPDEAGHLGDHEAKVEAIERIAGRTRDVRWGPRTLDVDLLLYGDETVDDPDLQVPHPRLAERAFVLVPLAQIAPDWNVPGLGRSVERLLADLEVGS